MIVGQAEGPSGSERSRIKVGEVRIAVCFSPTGVWRVGTLLHAMN